jgi:hypothetical protein
VRLALLLLLIVSQPGVVAAQAFAKD